MNFEILHGDYTAHLRPCDMIFADPKDNIGLGYASDSDLMPHKEYVEWFRLALWNFCRVSPCVWVSFNSKWFLDFTPCFTLAASYWDYEFKPFTQVITFYQQHKKCLGQAHRPLWRLKKPGTCENTQDIKIPSWRQENGDKRAAAGGKVPGDTWYQDFVIDEVLQDVVIDTVFNNPRVTGNSKQRRPWHPTQLNEELVERCIRLNTNEGDTVLDPFAGTGTTLRVCKRINRDCILIDNEEKYIQKLREEHDADL